MKEMRTLNGYEIVDKKAREEKIPLPKDSEGAPQTGAAGQVLESAGDGTTRWANKTAVDKTLTKEGAAADAKATGDGLNKRVIKGLFSPKMGNLRVYDKLNMTYDGANILLQGQAWVIYPNGEHSALLNIDISTEASDYRYVVYYNLSAQVVEIKGAISPADLDFDNFIWLFNFNINRNTRALTYITRQIDNLYFNGEQVLTAGEKYVLSEQVKKERPESGIVPITLNVDGKTDYGVLYLPINYTPSGQPVQLVINCHGAGTCITAEDYTIPAPASNLPDFGYAVCDINANVNAVDSKGQHWGDPDAIKSYLTLYDYVTKNYNVTKEVFISGTSMGGTTSNYLVNLTSIPVKAQAGFCTIVDIGKSIYLAPPYNYTTLRNAVNTSFGFANFEHTNDARICTAEELTHLQENADKLVGYNPIQFNCVNWSTANPYAKATVSSITDDTYQETREQEATRYNQLISTHKCPIKIWHCTDDTTVPHRYSKYYIEALKRGGCMADFREFETGGHNAYDNAEYTSDLTKIDGTTGTYNASTVELLEWFKKWK